MSHADFTGAKIALICGDELVAYRRDDKPDIPYPDCWDLAGGGREGAETPLECALRETFEEFGLRLDPDRVRWARAYPPRRPESRAGSWFFAADVTRADIDAIVFGDEGQFWRMMPIAEFLAVADAPPYLQERLRHFLADRAGLTPGTGCVP